MSESVWESFDGLFKTLHRQGRRVEELERRVVELERRLQERSQDSTGKSAELSLVPAPAADAPQENVA
jgi:hypothetical protein